MESHSLASTTWKLGGLLALGLTLAASPAEAQLSVCNKSTETVSIAVAYKTHGQMTSRGWYVAAPGECPTVVSGALRNRYYYIRARGVNGTEWSGPYSACTAQAKFSYAGDGVCDGTFEPAAFFQIDTGSSSDWTQNLTLTTAPNESDAEQAAIAALKIGWRPSALENGSLVMQVHNPGLDTVGLRLKCFTSGGTSKVLRVSIPARGMSEVGFVQGWPGNFVAGESCEALHGDKQVWTVRVPGT